MQSGAWQTAVMGETRVSRAREAGLDVPIRPDHVPQLEGEEEGEPGYTMLGRLFAFGYIRALIQATETTQVPRHASHLD